VQFPLEERRENKRVSSHRCHVQRAIDRLKNFKILSTVINESMRNVDKIDFTSAFLCNFQEEPLIRVDVLTKAATENYPDKESINSTSVPLLT
jgi:hypothetical protein